MNHVESFGDLTVLVGNDRVIDRRVLSFVDVFDPAVVRVEGIDTNADRFDTALSEFRFQLCDRTQFRRAGTVSPSFRGIILLLLKISPASQGSVCEPKSL
jgi:hypothetical protein